jgi:hypothetical protein
MQPDLRLHLDDADCDLDEPQAQSVELHHTPSRTQLQAASQFRLSLRDQVAFEEP